MSMPPPPPSRAPMPPPVPAPMPFQSEAAPNSAPGPAQSFVELIAPDAADELRRVPGGALLLGQRIVGGRVSIGVPLSILRKSSGALGVILFGWLYALTILRGAASRWVFVPDARTEFVRFELSESVSWRRVLPAAAISVTAGFVTFLIFIVLAAVAHPLLGALGLLAAWLVCNGLALIVLRESEPRLLTSRLRVEYGFPAKSTILDLACDSDASALIPRVEQLANVLDGFATWSHVSVHGGGAVAVTMKTS